MVLLKNSSGSDILKLSYYIKRLIPVLLYGIFYLACFFYLEHRNVRSYYIIHTKIDELIPFCEYFIIPYVMWFFYIFITVAYFLLQKDNSAEYYRLIFSLGLGMTVFLLISWIFPNGQDLRPLEFPRDNIFTDMIRILYRGDTSTNIFPSIHVFNSTACCLAVCTSEKLKRRKAVRWSISALTVLIILSTMFLKQHSVLDVICALALNYGAYALFYRPHFASYRAKAVEKKRFL
ncbi:MAG TPA: phosphatase PAP2 family protein [Candidatus Egerieimonas faecigallinarum]|nr:phosphatase PAP2 family protein [Candidatus Egerieimonas faecigallinarum]